MNTIGRWYSPSVFARARRFGWATTALVVILGLIVLVAIFAPLVAPDSPTATNILDTSAGPTFSHLLGTDSLGRDILSRLIYGSRVSLLGPLIVVLLSSVIGTALSISSVWIGGWYSVVIGRILDLLFSVPSLLIAILAVAFVGPGLTGPVIALGLAYTPYAARVVQSVAIRERNLAYIESGELIGFSGWSICTRHLVPNVMPMIRAQATISFGSALLDLAALSFLGLGVQPPNPAWGLMVSEGESALLNGQPAAALAPVITILVVVVMVNLLGDQVDKRSKRAS